ncbi:hypothetical protein P43SY_000504 [Pythium insidiosum]|uniref:HAT C-terminal dimerisation domain-containing protein n=1 Tax=Pythium insidiosum TaxID=114742 RepID=A0AAD5LPF9_PYTIN|nr:hypothetical protein P43SY_000504 [Pythium insidiosum]
MMEPSNSEPPLSDILPQDDDDSTVSPGPSTTPSSPSVSVSVSVVAVAADAALSVAAGGAVAGDAAASTTVAMIAGEVVDTDEAVALLQRHVAGHEAAPSSSASSTALAPATATATTTADPSNPTNPTSGPTTSTPSIQSNVSAVYRWYDIESTFSIKRREESSIARCRLCRQQGRQERKACVRFSKSVTSNLWRHLKENHPDVYASCASEKKKIQMHKLVSERKRARDRGQAVSAITSSAESSPATVSTTTTTTLVSTTANDDSDKLLDVGGDTERRRPAAKRTRRTTSSSSTTPTAAPHSASANPDMFFHDQYAMLNASLAGAHNTDKPRVHTVNADRIREAAAFLSLYEMVPIELCSSLAFRNLLNECHASSALMDDANMLASVFEAVTKLQDEQYIISSLVIPSVYTLLEKLRDISSIASSRDGMDLPEDMVAMKNNAYARLSSSFGYLFRSPDGEWSENQRCTFHWLWVATLLDPRTRPFIIKGPLDQVYFWDLVKNEAARISGAHKDTMDEDKGDLIAHEAPLEDDDPEKSSHHQEGPGSGDLWDDLQANLASCAQEEMLGASKSALEMTKSNNLIEVEVSFFQEEGRISLQENPLEWWQGMRLKYPFLARLARHVLSIPGHGHRGEDPLAADAGLYRNTNSQLTSTELTDFICATLNLTGDKIQPSEAPPRQLWSTV